MDVSEIARTLTGALLGVTAFYLARTVRLIDKLEDKLDAHHERIVRLEAQTQFGINPVARR